MTFVQSEPKEIYKGSTEIKAVYLGETKVRPILPDYLCFTAEQANSTVKLGKNGSPTSVTLETSTDGRTWTDYTFGTDITLTNIGDKVYWRNKSETATGFSTGTSDYYRFVLTGSIAASGDTNFLLCKNSTLEIPSTYAFRRLFYYEDALTSSPKLPATTLKSSCYREMFTSCTNLMSLPELPATTMATYCYYSMFYGCTKLKLASSSSSDYTQAYRLPTTGTGTTASNWSQGMFAYTGGTFKTNPSINTTYYVHKDNTIVG